MSDAPPQPPAAWWMREPTAAETAALGLTTMLMTVLMVSVLGGFWQRYPSFGDNAVYTGIAQQIALGEISALVPKHLWGYPYFGAVVSLLTPLSPAASLLVVCWVSAVAGLVLARSLWGGWVACFFAVTSIEWIQHAAMGGAETLSVALIFGSFFAVRRGRWPLAALLAAVCTIVRPEGAIALLALGSCLLWQRRFRTLAVCVAIGVAVGALYAIPLQVAFGDPFANYHAYESEDFGGFIVSWPFAAIVNSALRSVSPYSHKLMVAFWIAVVLIGYLAMIATPHFRRHAREHPYEVVYATLLGAFYFTYNSVHAFHQFVRFTLSLVPLTYFALLPWLPKDRRLLWAAGTVTATFSGMSAMNVRRSLGVIRGWFT